MSRISGVRTYPQQRNAFNNNAIGCRKEEESRGKGMMSIFKRVKKLEENLLQREPIRADKHYQRQYMLMKLKFQQERTGEVEKLMTQLGNFPCVVKPKIYGQNQELTHSELKQLLQKQTEIKRRLNMRLVQINKQNRELKELLTSSNQKQQALNKLNQSLLSQNNDLSKTIAEFSLSQQSHESSVINELRQQINVLKGKMQDTVRSHQLREQQLKKINRKQVQQLTQSFSQKLIHETESFSAQINSLKASSQALLKTIQQKQQQVGHLRIRLKELHSELQQKDRMLKQNQITGEKLQAIQQKHRQELFQQEQIKRNLSSELEMHYQTISTMNSQFTQKNRQLTTLQNQIDALSRESSDLKNKLQFSVSFADQYQEQIQRLNSTVHQLQIQLKQKTSVIQKPSPQRISREMESKVSELQDTVMQLNKQIAKKNSQLQELHDKVDQLQIKIVTLNRSRPSSQRSIPMIPVKFRFASDILHEVPDDQTEELVKRIEGGTGKKILRSSLLYKHNQDKDLNLNPHSFVDERENVLLLVKLLNGSVLGGFSVKEYRTGIMNLKEWPWFGTLFSLTNKRYFYLKNEPKAKVLTYDQYYIIFGNSEIRMKNDKNECYTNFATGNAYFNSENMKQDILLNEGAARETLFETYEIHQVFFDSKVNGQQQLKSTVRIMRNSGPVKKQTGELSPEMKLKLDNYDKMKEERNRLSKQLEQQKIECFGKQREIENLQRQIDQLNTTLGGVSKTPSITEKEHQNLKAETSRDEIKAVTPLNFNNINNHTVQKQKLVQQVPKSTQVQQKNYSKFVGELLNNHSKKSSLQFVIKNIQNEAKSEIQSAKLVFSKGLGMNNLGYKIREIMNDTLQTSDNSNNKAMLIICRSKLGNTFGVYTRKSNSSQNSMLMNIDKKTIINPASGTAAQAYSYLQGGSFIVFGNNEVKLSNQCELTINFDVMGERYFDAQKQSEWTNQKTPKIQLEEVEVLQIKFVQGQKPAIKTQQKQLSQPNLFVQPLKHQQKSENQTAGQKKTQQLTNKKAQTTAVQSPDKIAAKPVPRFRSFK